MQPNEFKKEIKSWLKIEDPHLLDFVLAMILTVEIPGDPIWAFLVAPPGGTKTELLRLLSDDPIVYTLSTLTPQTLISGLPNKRTPDILPLINGKMLIIKDFTSILQMDYRQRDEVFGQLREAYDGYLEKAFGSGVGKVSYESKFGILAGVTPAIDIFRTVHQLLGERFLNFRIIQGASQLAKIKAARLIGGLEDEMRAYLRDVTRRTIATLRKDLVEEFDESKEVGAELDALAAVTAKMRTSVLRDRGGLILDYEPASEIGTRLVKQYKKLGTAFANVLGNGLSEDVLVYLRRIARDTIPSRNFDLIYALSKCNDRAKTQEVAELTRLPKRTIRRYLENQYVLGNVDREQKIGTSDYWSLNEELAELTERCSLFKGV